MVNNVANYDLIAVIVNFGKGSKVAKIAKKNGVTGATILLGKGTVNSHILKLLEIADVRKEIVMMISQKQYTKQVIEALDKKFHFEKPNHGIVFTLDVNGLYGHHEDDLTNYKESRGSRKAMKNVIFVVVDKGKAEEVTESAVSAGARGATIMKARGSGVHEQEKIFFNFPVEPEKETVMILADQEITDSIVQKVRQDLNIDEPGKGILFTIPVNDAYGLY